MSKRKPAHDVVLDFIKESVSKLEEIDIDDGIMNDFHSSRVSSMLGVLQRMEIPKKHASSIANTLTELKDNCERDEVRELLVDDIIISIRSQEKITATN